jgi:predicted ester cyclase
MRAIDLVQATLKAWESNDANSLASYLSDEVVCRGFLPQPVDKVQYLDFMRAIMTAFPDWSFNGQVLYERPLTEHSQSVLVITRITGTHTGELILPPLPIIPVTGTRITFSNRHLEYVVTGETITTITADFSPNALEELLAHLGMVLP